MNSNQMGSRWCEAHTMPC